MFLEQLKPQVWDYTIIVEDPNVIAEVDFNETQKNNTYSMFGIENKFIFTGIFA